MLKKTYYPPSVATPIRTPSITLALISPRSLPLALFFSLSLSLAHSNTNKIVIIFPVSNFSHAIRQAFVLQNNYFCLTITFLPLTRIENVYLWLHTYPHRTHKIIWVHIFFFHRISWHYLLLLFLLLLLLLSLSSLLVVFSFIWLWAKDEPFSFSFVYCHLSSMPGHLYIDRKILYKSHTVAYT